LSMRQSGREYAGQEQKRENSCRHNYICAVWRVPCPGIFANQVPSEWQFGYALCSTTERAAMETNASCDDSAQAQREQA
jgi:hypothetical protein